MTVHQRFVVKPHSGPWPQMSICPLKSRILGTTFYGDKRSCWHSGQFAECPRRIAPVRWRNNDHTSSSGPHHDPYITVSLRSVIHRYSETRKCIFLNIFLICGKRQFLYLYWYILLLKYLMNFFYAVYAPAITLKQRYIHLTKTCRNFKRFSLQICWLSMK
jgi:hypothetical protein